MSGPLLKFTDRLVEIIDDISGPVAEMLLRIEADPLLDNYLDIETVDVSKSDWSFDIKVKLKNGQTNLSKIKVGKFIRYIMPGVFTDKEIYDFGSSYEKLKKGQPIEKTTAITSNKVEVSKFSFNPKDVRSTFLSLTTMTYPHGHEEEVMKFMPSGLEKDEFGNYYKIIGKSETMFTSHLDTADRRQLPVTVYSTKREGDEIFVTDGTSILGADDKSGVTVMLYMMAHNVPGIYYFFIGEERGGIGSNQVASIFEKVEHLKGVKRCVSFDRRNYYSVITQQLGRQCCSDEFATDLAKELNKSGMKMSLDPTGIYTDSASFIDEIPECTNISVGYFKEHTVEEHQNISFLERLAKACLSVNWEGLPTVKKVGFDEEILRKYKNFISEFKSTVFNCEVRLASEYGIAHIKFEFDEPNIDVVHEDLMNLSVLLNKYKMDPDIYFDDQYMKIELK
jgi:hypothetical protein